MNDNVEIVMDYRQLRHLPQSAVLEESGSPALIVYAIGVVAVLLACFIVWATFTTIDEVATATGEVIPTGQIRVVQHLEGGIVSELLVENDQHVNKGDVLVKLNSAEAQSELARMRSREMALGIDLARLKAFVANKNLDANELFNQVKVLDSKVNNKILQAMIDNGLDLFIYQITSRDDEKKILELQVRQRKEEYIKLNDRKKNIRKQIKLLKEEEKIYKGLEGDSVSRVTLLNVGRQLNEAYGELQEVVSDLYKTRQVLAESKQRLIAKMAELRRNAHQEIAEKEAELLDVVTAIQRTEDRVQRLSIVAPETGVVKGLELTRGAVISPGATVCEVVPLQQEMIVEARLNTEDIGHIAVGDKANVKVTTYDYVRYGQVTGKVVGISASTFLADDGVPYYRVRIKLNQAYVGRQNTGNRLLPGMVVMADIITGDKSILSYLLKPIHRSLQEAFRER